MKPRINVITVAVDDLEKSLAFYRDSLGWRPRWPAEGTVDPLTMWPLNCRAASPLYSTPRCAGPRRSRKWLAAKLGGFILTHVVSSRGGG